MLLGIKIVVGLFALLFALMGANLMFNPAAAAEGFFLSPIGEAGLNNLRGDFGGMFIGCSLFLILGLVQNRGLWFQAVALLMALIAAGRLIGFALDGAPQSASITAFAVEVVMAAVLVFAAGRLNTREVPIASA